MIVCGVAALLLVRQLPPDASLAHVREAGVLLTCTPSGLPPLLTPDDGADTGFSGSEAGLARFIAEDVGASVQWNTQPGWGRSVDPYDWGIRPGSCDLVVGGILVSSETSALLDLIPYRTAGWVLSGASPDAVASERVGLYVPYWGAPRGRLTRWIVDHGAQPRFLFDGESARNALASGEVAAVLTLAPTARWLADSTGGAEMHLLPGFAKATMAVATWKGQVTLHRAVESAVSRYEAPAAPADRP